MRRNFWPTLYMDFVEISAYQPKKLLPANGLETDRLKLAGTN